MAERGTRRRPARRRRLIARIVCAYDGAGSGYSPPNPRAHEVGHEIDDLQRLLDHAQVAPPYVLVGHSYGGLVARLFAHAHPREAAGVVLVDAMGRSQDRRFWRLWRAQPPRVRRAVPNPLVVGADQLTSEALADRITTLGKTRLAVITRGQSNTERDRYRRGSSGRCSDRGFRCRTSWPRSPAIRCTS